MFVSLRRFSPSLAVAVSLATLAGAPLSAQSLTVPDVAGPIGSSAVRDPAVALRARVARPAPALVSESMAREAAPVPAPVPVPGFETSGFAQFMSSPAGRILRIAAGAGMIAGGIAADSDLGTGIAIAGAVPLLAGTFDFCILSPLFGGPVSGKAIRAAKP
jgi:hypothetical protein